MSGILHKKKTLVQKIQFEIKGPVVRFHCDLWPEQSQFPQPKDWGITACWRDSSLKTSFHLTRYDEGSGHFVANWPQSPRNVRCVLVWCSDCCRLWIIHSQTTDQTSTKPSSPNGPSPHCCILTMFWPWLFQRVSGEQPLALSEQAGERVHVEVGQAGPDSVHGRTHARRGGAGPLQAAAWLQHVLPWTGSVVRPLLR